jgi:hypothetical protein
MTLVFSLLGKIALPMFRKILPARTKSIDLHSYFYVEMAAPVWKYSLFPTLLRDGRSGRSDIASDFQRDVSESMQFCIMRPIYKIEYQRCRSRYKPSAHIDMNISIVISSKC